MPIKYGDLTIIFNKEETEIFTSLLIWMGAQEIPPINSKYIFLFDDGEICDSDNLKDFNYKFLNGFSSQIPMYFIKPIEENKTPGNHYFHKDPVEENNHNFLLDFNELFSSYSKYDFGMCIKSVYNSIYYCYTNSTTQDIFGIIRTKSNGYMPRFQFAYDSDEFTKEEIVYIIHRIFGQKVFTNNA